MAETKKPKQKKPAKKSGSASKAKSSAKSKAKPKSASQNGASSNGNGVVHSIAPVAQKAVLPLVAVGAAAAGAVAVVAGKNGRKRKVLGVSLPKRSKLSMPHPGGDGIRDEVRKAAGAVTEAAKQADKFGQRVSSVASSVQSVGETTNDAAKKS